MLPSPLTLILHDRMSSTAAELLSTASSHLALRLRKLEKNKCSWDKTLRDCEFSSDIAGWQGGWQGNLRRIYTARSIFNIHLQCKRWCDLNPSYHDILASVGGFKSRWLEQATWKTWYLLPSQNHDLLTHIGDGVWLDLHPHVHADF